MGKYYYTIKIRDVYEVILSGELQDNMLEADYDSILVPFDLES